MSAPHDWNETIWTEADQAAANREGWRLHFDEKRGRALIQPLGVMASPPPGAPPLPVFRTDGAAEAHVIDLGSQGSALHAKALRAIDEEPEDPEQA